MKLIVLAILSPLTLATTEVWAPWALSFPKETRQTQPFLLSTLRKAVIQHIKTILPPVNQTDFQELFFAVPGREKYSVLGIKETQ
ncbi:predicted protein [Plenodomus lingam JN3]|uniref:Predicted protein n=1 Tax=Leptosphaeria maculans (strain JN3 / isolate v23.1.3 / race Av1-4-5-6-7-8) TaxID=985895 RepID=E4ZMV6_LEPMJ|nr:predicted protein [Plenodomus lingam JN3]CBX92559.1 predicted protein [Plenodomus lingam JN3]